MKCLVSLLFVLFSQLITAQPFSEYQSFSGTYDFVLVGNTHNEAENAGGSCTLLSESSATLGLNANQTVVAAYLYWSGSGTGDFDITLNGELRTASRTFSIQENGLDYFAAFEDVTSQIQALTTNQLTFSNFDIDVSAHCANATNYGGWAMVVVYEDAMLPVNDIRVNDGFVSVSALNPMVSITLEEPIIYSTTTATIGFLAWEGDSSLANGENLSINGEIIQNPPLNPGDNLFNGTNSYTGSTELYNMDLDFFDISSLINETDDFLVIEMNTAQDLIIMNTIVTKVKDATATDTDGDTVFDAQEDLNDNRILEDDNTDGDSLANFLDDDDDGDGTLTKDEDYNNNGTPLDDDTNGNNIPDYLDNEVFLGVPEFTSASFQIVPNPVKNKISIKVSKVALQECNLKVVSVSGQTIIDFGVVSFNNEPVLDVSILKQGLYFLNIEHKNVSVSKKFLKL